MIRLALLATLAPVAWFVRQYRKADTDALFIFDDRGNRIRKIVREEIAAETAEWDRKVTELGPIAEAGYQRQAERLRAELDDPDAVAKWLWSEGRA